MNDWLNYHHLLYFWVTAREGSVTRAARRLRLAPSTVSAQLRTLEDQLGQPLFDRSGRRMVLTDRGRVVLQYADEIFALGRDLFEAVRERPTALAPMRLRVGVASILPRMLAWRLLAPALHLDGLPVHLVCRSDRPEALVADLALHHLDLVLADAPVGLARDVHASSRLLGACGVSMMGPPALVAQVRAGFPGSLAGAPLLLPGADTTLRRSLERWFEARNLTPKVVAELDDSALLKAFAREGAGLIPVPDLVVPDVAATYGLEAVGALAGVEERVYAIALPTRLAHPVVAALLSADEDALRPPAPPTDQGPA